MYSHKEEQYCYDDDYVVWAGGIAGCLGGYDSIAENYEPVIRNCTFSGNIRASGINDGNAVRRLAAVTQAF